MAFRLSGGGIFSQRFSEADRLGAQVILNQAVSRSGRVTFGEKQIEDLEYRVQPLIELLGIGNLAAKRLVPYHSLGAHQPLRDGGLGGKKCAGYFFDSKTANDFQSERDARGPWQSGMATHEHKRQPFIGNFL